MTQYRGAIDLSTLAATPAAPASGYFRMYAKSTDSKFYFNNSSNIEHQVNHPGTFGPQDHGMLAWSYNFEGATSGLTITAGTIYMIGHVIPRAANATTIFWCNQAGGSTLTAAQCWVALLDSTGAVLQSVDISAKGAFGYQAMTIPTTAVVPGFYWTAFLFNGASLPALARGSTISGISLNGNRATTVARYCTNGASQTTITNRTPASNSLLTSAVWAAIG